MNEYGRMSALNGAAGVVHHAELTRVLLEAGADPDDGESLYHATESASPECLRLLLEHGATIAGTNAFAHALDHERLEHVRLLLDYGADPNEGALVAHAVRRGRGPEFLRLLAEHGADLDRPGGETWRGNVPLRTPYQHAMLRGRRDQAETLAELGASTEVNPEDAGVAAIALRGQLDLVVEAVGPSFRGVVGGSPEGTLLHHAAWVGDPELVRELLARGADPCSWADADFGTPLGWAALASEYYELPGRDYVAVAEALVDAGNEIEPRFLEVVDGPLYDWIMEHQPTALATEPSSVAKPSLAKSAVSRCAADRGSVALTKRNRLGGITNRRFLYRAGHPPTRGRPGGVSCPCARLVLHPRAHAYR